MLTFDPASTGGAQTFSIVFSSNAFDPSNFNGDDNSAALLNDSNQEIWVYRVPTVAADVNLSSGAELPVQDLSAGTFTRITNTPSPSILTIPLLQPLAGDSSQRIAFSLSATELGGGNADNLSEPISFIFAVIRAFWCKESINAFAGLFAFPSPMCFTYLLIKSSSPVVGSWYAEGSPSKNACRAAFKRSTMLVETEISG